MKVGLIGGMGFGSLSGLVGRLSFGPLAGVISGLGVGLFLVLAIGMDYGGRVSIGHYTLRWLLYRNGSLPFRDLIPFLDYCAERIFLRRVGGGYIFVHRLLEHFASLYFEQPPAPPSDGGAQAEIASRWAVT